MSAGDAVVVELAPADESSPYAAALLSTCDIGMHRAARCVLSREAEASMPDESGMAVAIVTWNGPARSEARIEVGVRTRGGPHWQTRVLSFSAADPEIERWRTAGFAIATLVGETAAQGEREATEPRKKEPSTPERAETRAGEKPSAAAAAPTKETNVAPPKGTLAPTKAATAPATAASPLENAESSLRERSQDIVLHSWIDAEFAMTGGLSGAWPAQGVAVGYSRLLAADRWFVTGALQGTIQSLSLDHISVARPGASAGGGLVVLRFAPRMGVAAYADAVLELAIVSATDPATLASSSREAWLAGLEQGIQVSWMGLRDLGVVVAGGVREFGGAEITIHETPRAHIPGVDFAARAGLRLAWP